MIVTSSKNHCYNIYIIPGQCSLSCYTDSHQSSPWYWTWPWRARQWGKERRSWSLDRTRPTVGPSRWPCSHGPATPPRRYSTNNIFKILNGYENIDANIFFKIKESKITNLTLVKKQSRWDVRKYSLSHRTINVSNKLSTDCVDASSTVNGRIRLVKFRHIRSYWLDVSNNFVFDWYRKWSHVRYVRMAGGPSVTALVTLAWRNYHVIWLLLSYQSKQYPPIHTN